MGIRRQVYLDENDDRLLEEQSRRTGLSVSELVRRAVQQCYGQGARLSWAEVFAKSVRANSAIEDPWVYDPLFDDELLDAELDQPTMAAQ
jgi:hypothetical protein